MPKIALIEYIKMPKIVLIENYFSQSYTAVSNTDLDLSYVFPGQNDRVTKPYCIHFQF